MGLKSLIRVFRLPNDSSAPGGKAQEDAEILDDMAQMMHQLKEGAMGLQHSLKTDNQVRQSVATHLSLHGSIETALSNVADSGQDS